jgi:ADP-ribosylglycohydrolase
MISDFQAAAALRASLLGDAIALGPHWIYDPSDITRRFGVITGPVTPPPDLYHPTKKAGDQTHLGDQVTTLAASIEACGFRFDPEDFSRRWEAMWTGYGDYFDKATKVTLAARQAGTSWTVAGATSEELGGAARMAPLLLSEAARTEAALVAAACTQAEMTHRSTLSLEAAAFLARAAWARLDGATLIQALDHAAAGSFTDLPADSLRIQAVSLAASRDARHIVATTGASCHILEALPASLAIALAFANEPHRALCENAMAGGDNAARGLVIGMLNPETGAETSPPKESLGGS